MPGHSLPEPGKQDLRVGSPLQLRIAWNVGRVWCVRRGEGVITFSNGWNRKDPAQQIAGLGRFSAGAIPSEVLRIATVRNERDDGSSNRSGRSR
jgi:hypothetical protein